jgi:hypothetical protein
MIIFIAIVGAILGAIFWSQMLRANQTTAALTLAQTQLLLDAMTPEERERVNAADEERRERLAIRKAADRKRNIGFAGFAAVILIILSVAHSLPQKKIESAQAVTPTATAAEAVVPQASIPARTAKPRERFWISPQ